MIMSRVERFKFLCIFGDGASHNWFEIIHMAVRYLKVNQDRVELIFKRCLEYQLLSRDGAAPDPMDDTYRLTARGDDCMRMEQIARGGDYSYYKYFDRSTNGSNGLNRFAPLTTKNGSERRREYFSGLDIVSN